MQLTRAQIWGINRGGGTPCKGKVLVLSLQQAHATLLPTPNVHRQKETKGQDLGKKEVNGCRRGKSNIQDLCTALMTREGRGAALRRQGKDGWKRP